MVARIAAPNVPSKIANLTDAEFAGFMRSGVRKDGTSPFIMPPSGFYHVSDRDLGAIIAYLRQLPVPANTTPPNSYRLLGRFGVMTGQFRTSVAEFDTTQERIGQDTAWATTRNGEYLVRLICTECHGNRLTGAAGPPAPTPSIAGAGAYQEPEFFTLLRTGRPRDPSTMLTMMAETARSSLKYLTDAEISAIYGYLKSLPATGVPIR
jgi:mono/diheme cytochrome c family protein